MSHILGSWLITFVTFSIQDILINGQLQSQCLSSTNLSCTEGLVKGLSTGIETRLLLSVSFTCNGTIVGWTVTGRRGSGTQFPKLQIWRRDSTRTDYYNKQGRDIQVDAQGSTCDQITQTCDQIFQCRLRGANQVPAQRGDIVGVELPPMDGRSGFDLLFISVPNTQHHYIFRRRLDSSALIRHVPGVAFGIASDQLLISLEINQDPSYTPLDVDECLANTDTCDQVCTNTIGSFQCSCIDGYTLSSDGRSCLDVNECTEGTHNCQQSCININGGFLCSCNSGHQLNSDGRTCSDVDECSANTDACDQVCTNTIGSFQCSCIDGYTLSSDGRSCLDVNERTEGTHNCQQSCININGGFLCSCNSGYQLNSDGRTCSEIRINASSIDEKTCLVTGAVVGGAIGTPLLLAVCFLVVALTLTVKKLKHKNSNSRDSGTDDMHNMVDILSTSAAKGTMLNAPQSSQHVYNYENVYETINDEERKGPSDDEYIEIEA